MQLADLLRLTQVTVMALEAEIRCYLLWTQRGRSEAGPNCHVRQVSGKWGVQVVVVRGEHEDPSVRRALQRAVDASLMRHHLAHYNAIFHLQLRAQRYLFYIR